MAEISMMTTPAESALAELFETARARLPGDTRAREDAFERFARGGLPHRRVEEWKYTDLRAAMRDAAPLAPKLDAGRVDALLSGGDVFGQVEAARIAIVNGHVAPEASDLRNMPKGVTATTLARAMAKGDPLLASLGAVEAAQDNAAYALNAAFMTDGVLLRVAAGTVVERPIHLRFIVDGMDAVACATRVLVLVEEGASLTLLETHDSPNGIGFQPNDVVEFVVQDRARVTHVRLNINGDRALALSTLTAKLGANVTFDTLNVVTGAALMRHQVYLTFAGAHSKGSIRGATMLAGSQHADTTLFVDHVAPHCDSRELFKAAIDGQGVGVFQGKILVKQSAQKTDGKMMSAAVLLSDEGTMNNKPELEIFADDVLCAHGATCGALDEDLLFYLMARGLPRSEAEALLLESFLGEAVEEGIEDEVLHAALMGVVSRWLKARE